MKILGRDYSSHYDAIIIGSGVGGLVCANLLAADGMKVLLIEQHYVLGGYCSTFRRKGFLFDSATHFYPLLGNPSTLTGKLLKQLEIPTEWIKMDPVDKFHFPGGEKFIVPADFSTYLERLKARFPHQVQQIEAFFSEVREAYLYGLLYYFRNLPNERAEKYEHFTLGQKLDEHFQDPKLKAYLTADHSHWGSLPSRTSFLFDSMLRLAYFLGNYYPKGSSQTFADDLGRAFKKRGGHILVYTMVEKLLVEEGKAAGVVARTRRKRDPQRLEFRAPVVVSNADAIQTYERLIGEENCGRKAIEELRSLRPSTPCHMFHMGLRKLPRELLEEVEGYYWSSWDAEDLTRSFFKVFFTTLLDPTVAPPDHDILIVQRWGDASHSEKTEDYQAHKKEVEERVMQQLRNLIPDLDNFVVVKMGATAYTSYRYTLNTAGAMLGWEMSPDQLGKHRPSLTTPVENLYMVGHWTRPGGGITPVVVSAQHVAEMVLSGRSQPSKERGPASEAVEEKLALSEQEVHD